MRNRYLRRASSKPPSAVAGAELGRACVSIHPDDGGQAMPRCVASGASPGHPAESRSSISPSRLCPSHRFFARRRVSRQAECGILAAIILAWSTVPSMMAQEEPPDPISELALEMEEVVIDLSGMTTGEPVQQTQKQIVARLDKLIEELEKESEQQRGGGSGANPSKPMADSMITGGPGGIGDLHAARKTGKQWAELPPHERDRIVQSMTEGFPAHYQKILERYYKRLAEEKPAGTVEEGEAVADGVQKVSGPKVSEQKLSKPRGAGVKNAKPVPAEE